MSLPSKILHESIPLVLVGEAGDERTSAHLFVILHKRWIVERTLAWISRNRRLLRDFERYARTIIAFVRLTMIRFILKRLIRPSPCP